MLSACQAQASPDLSTVAQTPITGVHEVCRHTCTELTACGPIPIGIRFCWAALLRWTSNVFVGALNLVMPTFILSAGVAQAAGTFLIERCLPRGQEETYGDGMWLQS